MSHVPEVSVVVQLRVEVDGTNRSDQLRTGCLAEAQARHRQLYRGGRRSIGGLAAQAYSRQRPSPDGATLVGRVRISRWRVGADGRTYHPWTERIGLGRNEASAGLREDDL
ncbi:MAG: hypothetical protein U0V56_00160 [Actinomycetota bacterium]